MALIKLNNRSSEDNAIHGRRNLIINGDFQINQRAVTSSTSNGYLADRWYCGVNNTHTQAIVSDAPDGFEYSHKITVGSASANTVLGYFFTKIEAQNIITPLGWDGAGNGSNAVLSFWVKSSVTGKYSTYSRNNADTENYIKTFTINSANTWEYKTLSITPPTAGTWTTDNTSGLQVSFGISGSASANAVASEGWHTANYIMTTDSTDLYTNAGATWQITGLQLEIGDIATPFEHRSYGEELALCQRYFAKLGADPNSTGNYSYQAYAAGCNQSNNTSQNIALVYPQTMRVTPTLAYSGNIGITANGSYVNVSTFASSYGGTKSTLLQTNTSAVGSAGHGVVLLNNADNTAYITLTAEM
jgi:hypothetical protein